MRYVLGIIVLIAGLLAIVAATLFSRPVMIEQTSEQDSAQKTISNEQQISPQPEYTLEEEVLLPRTGEYRSEEFELTFSYPRELELWLVEDARMSYGDRWQELELRGGTTPIRFFLGQRGTDGGCMGFDYATTTRIRVSGAEVPLSVASLESADPEYANLHCVSVRTGNSFYAEGRYDQVTAAPRAGDLQATLALMLQVLSSMRYTKAPLVE